jgi:hydroxyacylglutathione hydrolase
VIFTQYYLDCLSQASYLIGDETTGRAVVVDPRRDVGEYVADADAAGLTIELVIETHFHADFLSGHLELARATGADVAFGSVASPEFAHRPMADGERLDLGDVGLEFLHTPGHTPESMSIVVYEHREDEVPYAVLTGDTLFIGDVGRPDLLASVGVTKEELAGQLYDSLHTKLMTLPDATRVFPAHGAGSACGKNLSTETQSTIGRQRIENYAVQPMSKPEFVEVVTEGQPAAPEYFSYDVAMNKTDHEVFDDDRLLPSMTLDEVDAAVADGAVVLDTRSHDEHARGHLVGSINVGLDGRYAEFVGTVVAPDAELVIMAEPGHEREAMTRLARIGYDRVTGSVDDPIGLMTAHPDRVERASRLTAADLSELDRNAVQMIDVRNPGEVADGTLSGAQSVPLAQLPTRISELDPTKPTVVFCAGGYRSSVAASLLRSRGFSDVSDVLGGYGACVAIGVT